MFVDSLGCLRASSKHYNAGCTLAVLKGAETIECEPAVIRAQIVLLCNDVTRIAKYLARKKATFL